MLSTGRGSKSVAAEFRHSAAAHIPNRKFVGGVADVAHLKLLCFIWVNLTSILERQN